MRLLRACGPAELREVASGSATQSHWLRNGKVGSQVGGVDRPRLAGRRTVGEVKREGRRGRRASDRAEKRVYRYRVRLGRERRASRLPCLSLGLGDDRQDTSGSGDVSLAICIASVSDSESLASFTNRAFHLSRPPGFRMAFDAAKRNGRFGRIQYQRSKKSSSRGKRRVFLCRTTVRVEVQGKAIPASFLKIEGPGTLVGAKDWRKRDRYENWKMVRTQVLKHLPRAGESKRGRSKGDVRRRATVRGAVKKGGCVRVIEGEEVRRDNPVEYFLPAGVGGTSGVPEGGIAIKVLQNEEISGGKDGGRKGVGSAIRWAGANRGGAYTLGNDSEEELFRVMLIPT